MEALSLILSLGIFLGPVSAPAAAQSAHANKGESCPYCRNSPEILKKAGLVGHGPFPYANTTSTEVEKHLAYVKDLYWLESEHFRVLISLPAYSVPEKDKKKIHADLAELQALLPSVNPKSMNLDPWLRLHLIVFRAEKFYKRFLDLLGLQDSSFPDSPVVNGKYMGQGRYLGQADKYQLFFINAKAPYLDFLKKYVGSEQEQPRRHNFVQQGALWFGTQTVDDQLNRDLNLYATMLHNLAQNFIDGFKHYSYEMPVWINEGFAHWASRSVTEDHICYCFVETYQDFKKNGDNWPQEIRRRLGTGGVSSLAELSRKKSYSELSFLDHIVSWSMIDFMIKDDPKKFAALLDAMKGRLAVASVSQDGISQYRADGSNLTDVQRNAMKEIWGFSYPQFEAAWRAWVAKEYSTK